MTIDTSYFQGELSMGQITSPAVVAAVNLYIAKYEDLLLSRLMGYELYKAYKAGINVVSPASKWTDIRDGKEYTPSGGVLTRFRGLRFTSTGTTISTPTIYPLTSFVIGDGETGTPLAGATVYTNSELAGLTASEFLVFRDGLLLTAGIHYSVNAGGGFTLIVTDDEFGTDEQFSVVANRATPEDGDEIGLKQSPIANYVYFHYLKDNVSFTMGAGEVKPKSNASDKVSPYPKMVRAWNEMVDWNWELIQFLSEHTDTYTELSDNRYPWCGVEELNLKNTLGI